MAIYFNREETQFVLTGKTFDLKEKIKALGGKWNPERRIWTLPLGIDMDEIQTHLGTLKPVEEIPQIPTRGKLIERAQKKRLAAKAKDLELVKWCLADTSGKYSWVCCEKCEIVDFKKGHSSCMAHAHWDGQSWCSFRIFGSLYTGT